MATYEELRALFNDAKLLERVETAVVVSAAGVFNNPGVTAEDKQWAISVWRSPRKEAQWVLMAVLAANKDVSVAAITSVLDPTLQTHVDAVFNVLTSEPPV